MGRGMYLCTIIRDKKLYKMIKRSIYRHLDSLDLSKKEMADKGEWNYHSMDLAKFIGLKDEFEGWEEQELTEEEKTQVQSLWEYSSKFRTAFAYISYYKEKKGYYFVIGGVRDFPSGLLSYISTMTPEEEYSVMLDWEFGQEYKVLKNGVFECDEKHESITYDDGLTDEEIEWLCEDEESY